MNIGMLWRDHSDNTLEHKLKEIIVYYKDKYKSTPNTCHVNPSMIEKRRVKIENVTVIADDSIMVNYFWIGRK